MGISLSAQTAYFLWALVMGAALGVLYDGVRIVRMTLRAGRIHVMISDTIFFGVCGVLTSLFALPFNKGDVRVFILFAEGAGFLVYRLTLGSLLGKVYAFFARSVRGFVQKTRKILEIFFDFLLKAIGVLVYNVNVIVDRLAKQSAERKHVARKKRRQRQRKETVYEQKKRQKAKYRRKAARR